MECTYTIYDHPSDFPDKFVVRRWLLRSGEPEPGGYFLADTLEGARAWIPSGCICIEPDPSDDANIIETWM